MLKSAWNNIQIIRFCTNMESMPARAIIKAKERHAEYLENAPACDNPLFYIKYHFNIFNINWVKPYQSLKS